MMNLHQETIYIPFREVDDMKQIGYVIATTKKECRQKFVESMGTGMTWKFLAKQGWKIVPAEVVADERDVYPGEFEW